MLLYLSHLRNLTYLDTFGKDHDAAIYSCRSEIEQALILTLVSIFVVSVIKGSQASPDEQQILSASDTDYLATHPCICSVSELLSSTSLSCDLLTHFSLGRNSTRPQHPLWSHTNLLSLGLLLMDGIREGDGQCITCRWWYFSKLQLVLTTPLRYFHS